MPRESEVFFLWTRRKHLGCLLIRLVIRDTMKMASLLEVAEPWDTSRRPRRFKKEATNFEGSVGDLKDRSSSLRKRLFVFCSI